MREETVSSTTPDRAAHPGAASNGAAANGEAEVPPWAQFSPARGRFVRFVIVFSIALTLLAAASVYWRSANVYEPTSYITVLGNESLNGTVVVVSSPDFPESMATLSKDNEYMATIFLHPGSYVVTATHNDETLAKAPFTVTGRKAISLNLAARKSAAAATGVQGT